MSNRIKNIISKLAESNLIDSEIIDQNLDDFEIIENAINQLIGQLQYFNKRHLNLVNAVENRLYNDDFSPIEYSENEDIIDVITMSFNTYIEELSDKMISKDYFHDMFNNLPVTIFVFNSNFKIVNANKAALDFFSINYHFDEKDDVKIELPDQISHFVEDFKNKKDSKDSKIIQLVINKKKFFIDSTVYKTTLNDVEHVLFIGIDITEKYINQNKILRATLHGQELERKWISQELHDSLGQNLNAAISHFNASLEMDKNTDLFNETVQTSKDLLLDSIDFIRKMAQNLKMADFENTYFVQTVIDFTNKLKNLGPEFIVSANTNSIEFDNKKDELFVFRIIQEFVNNTMKHANATLVYIIFNFKKKTHELDIKILDDGIGFDMEKTSFNNGIHNIKQRLKALNAEYNFKSKVGKGTELKFTLNLSKSKKVSKSKTKTTHNTI